MDVQERVALRPPRAPQDFDLRAQVIGEHDGVIFLDKPAGWPTSGRTLDDERCLQHRVMTEYGKMVWAVHQLDGDTSGVNVFAAQKSLVPRWQQRLRFPEARKEYLALVHGEVRSRMRIEAPIGRRADGSWGVSSTGKSALTLVAPIATDGRFSLLRIHLRTGRTHQIRVHLSHHGHPLVGEFWYNDAPCLLADRHMLHAWRTRFDRQQEPGLVVAAVPADMREVAATLGVPIPAMEGGDATDRSGLYPHPPK